jgi:hypothetical protein
VPGIVRRLQVHDDPALKVTTNSPVNRVSDLNRLESGRPMPATNPCRARTITDASERR